MKKVFKIEDLDCAHCAAKIEEAVKKIEGVTNAQVSFLSQKFTLEADETVFDDVLAKAVKVFKKVEPDCNVIVK
jgi:copper chaperone CopZ